MSTFIKSTDLQDRLVGIEIELSSEALTQFAYDLSQYFAGMWCEEGWYWRIYSTLLTAGVPAPMASRLSSMRLDFADLYKAKKT